MLVTLKEILTDADKKNYAVPAFNVYNMETVMGVMQAAKEAKAPVIFQMYSRLFDGPEARMVAPCILQAIQDLDTPAAFHLDHGAGVPEVLRALQYGASGIMIDASLLPLEENIANTKNVVELCKECGVSVEGELGHIGKTADASIGEYTKVDEAVRYVKETGISALAILVGTAHGHYKKAPVLDIQRIADIKAATGISLVLHGGSGVPDDQITRAVAAGIRKMNFGTDVCCSFLDEARKVSKDVIALDLFMKEPVAAVKRYALSKIKLLGAEGNG